MEDTQRWSVTYTKHVKQKRKVYQDGFLELQPSRHKVMVYDEWDKLLECKFVKKEDVIKSGETITFNSYLVDIGEQCGSHKPTSTLNGQEKDKKVAEKSGSLHGHEPGSNSISSVTASCSFGSVKPTLLKNRARGINISPSQKFIRDFRSEANKCGSSPSLPDMTKTSTTKWQVLYTAQITQKAKKFHDGILQLVVRGSQGRQVMLFDEWDKLLESRFLKKDDDIKSDATLMLSSYLVEIGEQCGAQKPMSSLDGQEKGNKVAEQSGSLYDHKFRDNSVSADRKPSFAKNKARVINLSPSQKIIRDFKKNEMNKCGSSPSFQDMTKTNTTEWQVLYTTQITQKAKKFHDGFLQLVVRGSQGRQVMLYDITRRHLNSRFLKKDEIVCSGESLSFESHLVEIGEQEGDHKPVIDLTLQGKNCKVVGKPSTANNQAEIPTNNKFPGKAPDKTCPEKLADLNDSSSKVDNAKLSWRTPATEPRCAGKTPDKTCPVKFTDLNDSSFKVDNTSLSSRTPTNEPRRAVHDILSILRRPIQTEVVTLKKPKLEEHLESHASDVHSNFENQTKGYAEECKESAREELRETTTVHDLSFEITKSETVTRSSEIKESENFQELYSCEEIITETTASATHGLSSSNSSELHEDDKKSSSSCREADSCVADVASNDCTSNDLTDVEEKTLKQDLRTKEMSDFPSFDLGF